MIERDIAMASNLVAYPRILSLPILIVGVGYLAGYVLLDWISFIEPYSPLNITPWNPGTGLSFVLVILFGLRLIPFLFIGPLLGDLLLNSIAGNLGGRAVVRCPDWQWIFRRFGILVAPKRAV